MVIVIFAILVTQVFGLDKPTCPADKPTCGQVKVDGEWLIGEFLHFLPPLFCLPFSVSFFFFVPLSAFETPEKSKMELVLVPFVVFPLFLFLVACSTFLFPSNMLLFFFIPTWSSPRKVWTSSQKKFTCFKQS
jgi:hypothetical protein